MLHVRDVPWEAWLCYDHLLVFIDQTDDLVAEHFPLLDSEPLKECLHAGL